MSNVNYRIVPIGSSNQGWAIECDGKITRTGGSLEVLGAWLDAILAGTSTYHADDIAEVIEQRPGPSYEKRPRGVQADRPPEPSRESFPIVSKGGGRPVFEELTPGLREHDAMPATDPY